tara:strand:+ start:7631 stop:7810 length:180 start_codon:yes stop_codon:yes gene_type:complete
MLGRRWGIGAPVRVTMGAVAHEHHADHHQRAGEQGSQWKRFTERAACGEQGQHDQRSDP